MVNWEIEELERMHVNNSGKVMIKDESNNVYTYCGNFETSFVCWQQKIILANEMSCYSQANVECENCGHYICK